MNKRFYVLVTGSSGLLGSYLMKELENQGILCKGLGKRDLDITDKSKTIKVLKEENPSHIVNCAAYTNVPQAESQKELCYSINVDGVKNLTIASKLINARLLHISTDFVFDGKSSDSGLYDSDSVANPLNYYGITKHLAEEYIIKHASEWNIIRTSWLYGNNDKNFVEKIIALSLVSNSIKVTTKEVGSPTYALDLSQAIVCILKNDLNGIYHLSNYGFVSRYDFVKEILKDKDVNIEPLSNFSFDNVTRPEKIILDDKKNPLPLKLRDWKTALNEYLSLSRIKDI